MPPSSTETFQSPPEEKLQQSHPDLPEQGRMSSEHEEAWRPDAREKGPAKMAEGPASSAARLIGQFPQRCPSLNKAPSPPFWALSDR